MATSVSILRDDTEQLPQVASRNQRWRRDFCCRGEGNLLQTAGDARRGSCLFQLALVVNRRTHFGTWLQCLFRSTYHMPERNQRTAWHAPPGLGRDVWDSRAGHDESDALRGVVWRWYALSNGCLAFETEAARTFCSLCWCTCVCISKREQQCQHRTFVSVAAPKYLVPKDVHVHLHRKEKNRLPGNTTSNFSK